MNKVVNTEQVKFMSSCRKIVFSNSGKTKVECMLIIDFGFFRYMVDAADPDKIEASRNELHNLLDKPQLAGIPVLVLGNKRDKPQALDENGLIERM